MDPKAAAKSKRTHTVHGRRNHPTPSAAAAAAHRHKSTTTASSPGAGGGGGSGRGRNLSSNWDRYDSEDAAAAAWPGEVGPKSKGADFGFLLEQARSQPREARGLGVPWLASEESPFDFMQGSTSMLSAKSEGILTWCQDDNLIIDDDSVPNVEVPFLSMDLHALARQLSKLKLSQRLFMEEDLLPEDLLDGSGDNQMPNQPDTSMPSGDKDTLAQQESFFNIQSGKDVPSQSHANEICFDDEIKQDLSVGDSQPQKSTMLQDDINNSQLLENSNTREAESCTVPSVTHSVPGRFEVSAAEAELDMLLDSFSETYLSSSTLDESIGNNSTFRSVKVGESNQKVRPASSSRTLAVTPLNDALDDLSTTSLSLQDRGDVASTSWVASTSGDFTLTNLTSRSVPNSDDNIDLEDAKQIEITTCPDVSIDELLVETSACLKTQKQSTTPEERGNIQSISAPHSSSSNAPDDFDSWFDSL